MADISAQINKINLAVFGEEVRSSITGALTAMNVQADAAASIASSMESRLNNLERDSTAKQEIISLHTDQILALQKADVDILYRIEPLEDWKKEAEPKIKKALEDNEVQDDKIRELEKTSTSHEGNLREIFDTLDDNARTDRSHTDRITALESANTHVQLSLGDMLKQIQETANAAATAYDTVKDMEGRVESMEGRMPDFMDDMEVIDGYLYGLNNGIQKVGPLGPFSGGGGGGGTSGNNAVITVQNLCGWTSKVIPAGSSCIFTGMFTCIENDEAIGNGAVKVMVNGAAVGTRDIPQGSFEIDLAPYLTMGNNNVRIQVQDIYGNQKTLAVSVKVIVLTLSSSFDNSGIFDGPITFTYVPTGAVTKTVKILIDGRAETTQTVTASDRQQTVYLPQQGHGSHSLECYFTAVIDGQEVESNHLYYDLTCIKPGDYTKIVAIDFNQAAVSQFSNVIIPFTVYDPESLTAEVTLEVNGSVVNTLTVDRNRQLWSFRANEAGPLSLTVRCGEASKTVNTTVTEVDIDVEAETSDLKLYLTSTGRSNAEANPASWESQGTPEKWPVEFRGFNWVSNGWVTDEDGIPVFRVSGEAGITIPYKPLATDCRTTGKTIEFEFATRDVRDYDAEIISCMSNGIGFKLTAQEARLKSSQSEIMMQYKDDEHLRVSFVIEKRNETRLIFIYVDGIISGVAQYPANDDFSQVTPAAITIGHPDCTVDLYNIRIYDNNLSKHQMVDNWIADTQNGALMLERYGRNNVYDEYGQVVISNLPKDLPYMILQAPELPQSKGDKKSVSGQYVDPTNSAKSYTFEDAAFDVQGTSSQHYKRKNYKGKFKGFLTAAGLVEKWAMRAGSIAESTFCFKADVASSEGVNNVELVRLYNDACPWKTAAQKANPAVRQGIDGFPCVFFWNDGGSTTFLGKYNYNLDKGTPASYGFKEGDQSWETKNNTSDRALFKGWKDDAWADDFEGRYPDGFTEVADLQSFVETVAGWTNPTAADLEAVCVKESAIFYFIFTELFLMVDSRAKNAFPTKYADDAKWCWLPYDFDTAIGINNEGQLVFGYNLETGDKVGEADVFNGQGHKFWEAVQTVWADDIAKMYADLRASGALSFEKVRQMFDEHQSKWPEAIFNEDAQYKYLDPLAKENDASYLTMLQGSKKSQRDWWLYHRFKYMDSKYGVADNLNKVITVRGYAKADLTVTPYADTYVNVKYGSYLVQKRGVRNVAYRMECPLDNVNDTETYIQGAEDIKKIEGLPDYQVGYANFTYGTKLIEIVLGKAAAGYVNEKLTELHLGQLKLLQKLDCRNCISLGTGTMATIDASGCSNLEEVYMDNTVITGMDLPNGGQLKKLHLPGTITNLTVQNQKKLQEVVIPDYSNISTLWIENVNNDVLDPIDLLDHIAANARVRLIGFDLGTVTVDELSAFMDKLDGFRGLDENGNNMDKAQVSGNCHITALTGAEMQTFKERYPYINVSYDHITSYIYYYTEDGETLLHTEAVYDGADAVWTGTSSKATTAQYTYTFDGWSRTPGGALWADAKKAVSADRNVYAHFQATIRKYTATFVDPAQSNKTLKTQTDVPYGSVPSAPDISGLKDSNGMPAQGWIPAVGPITGNTTYQVTYKSPVEIKEIEDSWPTIISHVKDGTYSSRYMLGNYKPLDLGSEGTINMEIVAFDKDQKADGSLAAISWLSKELLATSKRWNPSAQNVTEQVSMGPGWIVDEENGGWKSNNQSKDDSSATATWQVTVSSSGTLTVSYKVGSEASYDKLTVKVDGATVANAISGDQDWADHSVNVSSGQTVTVTATYSKDSSGNANGDTAYLKLSGTAQTNVTFTPTDMTSTRTVGYVLGTGTSGGWEMSELRTYYNETLLPLIPTNVAAAIVEVQKTHPAYRDTDTNSFTQTTLDKVWIPSYNEMFAAISNGGIYRNRFDVTADRIKSKAGGSATWWWLRSANSNNYAYNVDSSGSGNGSTVNASGALALGFCF